MYAWLQPVVSIFSPMLTLCFWLVQDWGLAIVLFTLIVRFFLSPLNLKIARQQILQQRIRPKMLELQERYKSDPQQLAQAMVKLYQQHGIKPLMTFAAVFLQAPIFMGMYALFLSQGAAMSSILIPWVSTFAQPDAWHILPALSISFTYLVHLLPLTGDLLPALPLGQRAGTGLLMVPVLLLFLWKAPVATALYWVAGSIFALLERVFYRTAWGRRVLSRGLMEAAE
ncbi:YidC/Oxa1 family membrane protein insertase [Brevibacillus sp. B_LB10_24]|uniref:YidC/Oxa1 family membrane protein insertase n=1 Tax=Brevibacillus sp. B_LB10_24 TaxID=3380645 RepID=UPI0038BB7CD6